MRSKKTGVISGISAYYHNPPVWVGSAPSRSEFEEVTPDNLIRDEFRAELYHGIKIRVRRDGLFVFDCSSWEKAGLTKIPAFSSNENGVVSKEYFAAEQLAERRAMNRVLLMNVHQACLCTAHCVVNKSVFPLGHVIVSSRAIYLSEFECNKANSIICFDYCDMFHRLALEAISNHKNERLFSRRVFELGVVSHSFDILNSLLKSNYDNILVLVELLYRAGALYADFRCPESLVLSWSVIENLIGHLWRKYINSERRIADGLPALGKARQKKLTGRDYTASIMLEVLEMTGRIDAELFERINNVRRSRNNWLHSLDDVSNGDASAAVQAAASLLQAVTGIYINITLSQSGGYVLNS